MLCQQRSVKRCRRVRIDRPAAIVPAARFQKVDAVLPAEVVEKAAAQPSALILHLMLGVQRDDALAGLPHIAQKELQKEALALAGVAEDQGAGIGLVRRAAVQVYDDVGAEAITSDKEAAGICFAGIIHGIQICNAPGGKHPLGKARELCAACGIGGEEAILLAQGQRVGAHAGADELR